uniref:Reverse transcriptase domain-containing protein n=1 Tax=Rhizophagus irregularis (strain DAOM 181602 / DAOM 197198 / MUCL 43194) TaxID=747089 RepID=U9SUU7_RHIID
MVGPSQSPFKTLNSLPERWKNCYTPISSIDPDIYSMVMVPIGEDELLAVINNSPHHKAPGPSSIPYEWFRLLSSEGIFYLCKLMNSCLAKSDILEDWRLASIVPIPKPHEFECLLKNTRPITLLETVQKLLVKIITDRLSRIMTKYQVLTGNNFAGLPGSSVNTPINILDGIMKSHRVSQIPQEFLFTSRKNRILTPFGKTESYNLLIGIDQGEIISPLLWTIYFDPLLTELSSSAISPYIWSSGIPANILNINNNEDVAVPITQLTYMDDSTLIASSLAGLEQLLSIACDFYFLNNITANFSKYELVSLSAGNNLISFQLNSEFPDHLSSMGFSLRALRLSSSFRFLGVWFNLQGSPNFVLSQLKDIYSSFLASVRFKKLSPVQLAYLHSSVVLPKAQFRFQVLYLSESQVMRIVNGYYGLQHKAFSVVHTFPSITLTSRFFSKDVNPYDFLCERLLCHFLSWISLLSTGSKQANLNDLKHMGLIAATGKIPSWFRIVTSLSNRIDISSYIRLRNKYYWIAGVDSSNSLIFGQVFYTFDDDSGTRVVYFSHWIPTTSNQMQITPCPGCSFHCLDTNEGPLTLKTVGRKLIHRSCLSILPSYRCLQLFQIIVYVDISQQIINLKLSLFILCSYFRFLSGFSELYIPDRYSALAQPPLLHCDSSPASLPDLTPVSNHNFALRPDTTFHISKTIHAIDSITSLLVCAWVQTLDDFILDSGIFSCPMISPYNDVAELAFILYVLNSLTLDSSVSFVSSFIFDTLFSRWCDASPIRRVQMKNHSLWSCISELLKSRRIACRFSSFVKDSIPTHSVRARDLIKVPNWPALLQPTPLIDDIFPSFLKIMGLFTGYDELLTRDPVNYWRSFTDIRHFFSLIGLSHKLCI